jgi:hypothetical protein
MVIKFLISNHIKVKLNNKIYYKVFGPKNFKYYTENLEKTYNLNKNKYILFKDFEYYNKDLKKLVGWNLIN